MKVLLKGIGGAQKNDIHKKITGYFSHPYTGPVNKIAEYHIHKNRKADKEDNETC
jgi:hypothetical protein